MYQIVWAFDVKAGNVEAFERGYGPSGDWAQLFRKNPGYTIDRWASRWTRASRR